MYIHETKIRVRYGETDQMGYVYYGNYCQYFEVARVEMLRSLGVSYKSLEDSGVMLPVLDLQIKYIKPAFYDDELTIVTSLKEMPGVRIQFEYQIKNAAGDILNLASTTLVFVEKTTGKPQKAPQELLQALAPFFKV